MALAFDGRERGVDPQRHVRAVAGCKPAIEQFDRRERAVGELRKALLREAERETTLA